MAYDRKQPLSATNNPKNDPNYVPSADDLAYDERRRAADALASDQSKRESRESTPTAPVQHATSTKHK